jgi:hypothetical protein
MIRQDGWIRFEADVIERHPERVVMPGTNEVHLTVAVMGGAACQYGRIEEDAIHRTLFFGRVCSRSHCIGSCYLRNAQQM